MIMKKIFYLVLCGLMFTVDTNAQMVTSQEVEEVANTVYGIDKDDLGWKERAKEAVDKGIISLDQNNALQYTEVINCNNTSKEQLYVILNYWFTQTFNDANSVIKLNDKELGTIIGQGYLDVAKHIGGMNIYDVSIRPIIKCDIKPGKIRVTYTVQAFEVTKTEGGGGWGGLFNNRNQIQKVTSNWPFAMTYPFVEKPKMQYKAPKATSKGLIMAAVMSEVLLNKIKKAVQDGISGNETDEW